MTNTEMEFTLINCWTKRVITRCFYHNYFRIELLIGKFVLFRISVEPGARYFLHITTIFLGFGFSILVGRSHNKDIS